jgi:hypothetical protein
MSGIDSLMKTPGEKTLGMLAQDEARIAGEWAGHPRQAGAPASDAIPSLPTVAQRPRQIQAAPATYAQPELAAMAPGTETPIPPRGMEPAPGFDWQQFGKDYYSMAQGNQTENQEPPPLRRGEQGPMVQPPPIALPAATQMARGAGGVPPGMPWWYYMAGMPGGLA